MKTAIQLLEEPMKAKRWVVRWWGDPDPETGTQKRCGKAFRHQREARLFVIDKQAELERGLPRQPAEMITLAMLLADFEESRLGPLKHPTQVGYRHTMGQLRAYFGDRRLIRDILPRHAEAFIASRVRLDGRKGELAPWSKLRHVIHCRTIFHAGLSWGYIDTNPFSIRRETGSSPLRIKAKGKSWHHLTPKEFRTLLSVTVSVQYRAAYWLMYGCGLRPGEAYNLTVDNIDLHRRRVHIVNRTATLELPPFSIKADGQSVESKERSVPLPDAAIPDVVAALKTSMASGGFVTLTPERFVRVQANWKLCRESKPWAGHAGRPWQNRDMQNNLLRDTLNSLRRAGIRLVASFNLHTFRKSFAQNHADAGTPPRTLAQLLGHSNTRVTMQFYNRVTDANERAAAALMNQVLTGS